MWAGVTLLKIMNVDEKSLCACLVDLVESLFNTLITNVIVLYLI